MTEEETIKELKNMMTKEKLAKMYLELNQSYIKLQKFLYENYKPILREWESKHGKIGIEFAGGEDKSPKHSFWDRWVEDD